MAISLQDMEKDERIETVKSFKLSKKRVEEFEQKLQEIKQEPIEEEMLLTGELQLTTQSLLKKMIEINLLHLEMNLDLIKNVIASHIEHDLDKEIQTTQMTEKLSQTFKQFGIDENTFKRMFGG
jgi:hypothetical protein